MGPVNLRVVGLGAAVTVAVLLPLVARAGPTGEPTAGARERPAGAAGASADGTGAAGTGAAGSSDAKPGDVLEGLGLSRRTESAADPAAPPVPASPASPPVTPRDGSAAPDAPERVANCGPELASPEGVEAQTCVLAEGSDTWGRTYYRNATGQNLDAFLTLMAPGGRTVQVRCPVAAQDEPGTCETPRERGRGVATAYTAVAEFAGAGEGGNTPLLLRAGSNTAGSEGS
ncbi:hypothetical protein ACIOMM_26185 [Streptomyces sp. NPDC087908]|uniref:hypothetical protein n=1 Tax=unclassified Streptomyces TaxID=2593676 RepID=UPI0011CEA911|nr:hypothetical protein [Streptomyces sp. adm13(2018)]TXS16702.1 hypothetical protein EAO70_14045 [Streptomyces sp. adm13(2018)]